MQNNEETIRCKTVRLVFERDLYKIVRCRIDTKTVSNERILDQLRDNDNTAVVCGNGLRTAPDLTLKVTGTWAWSDRFKQYQFKALYCEDAVGESKEDIVRYLSYILYGVGPVIAEAIYNEFGKDTIRILEEDPKQFLSVPGIGNHRIENIIESFEKNREYTLLTKLLSKYGVSFRMIVNIYRALGENAHSIIRDNPYVLCRVAGYGFIRADEIAMSMNADRHAFNRIAGAVYYTLNEKFVLAGHTFAYENALINACISNRVLNSGSPDADGFITGDEVKEVIQSLSESGDIVRTSHGDSEEDQNHEIYLPMYYHAERYAAFAVTEFIQNAPKSDPDCLRLVYAAQTKNKITLDETQLKAAVSALTHNISIITGGPGTGKTASLKCIVDAYKMMYPKSEVALAAPTGRAARRMKEQTGYEASTLHRLMHIDPHITSNFSAPATDYIKAGLLIVDESSMIDIRLFAEMMYRLRPTTKLVILGDTDQLPSVGAGNVLSDLINSYQIPVARLTTIHRQGEDSIIPRNAAAIRLGQTDLEYGNDFRIIEYNQQQDAVNDLRGFFANLTPEKSRGYQVISPRKKGSVASVNDLNLLLQETINPEAPNKPSVNIAGIVYRIGDPIIITRNSENLSNGDMGTVVEIIGRVEDKENFRLGIDINGGRTQLTLEQALDTNLAYAITVHKSQGSEFPAVIVPIFENMGAMFLQRNLIYTAITRARKSVVIMTDSVKTVFTAIRTANTGRRNSNLITELMDIRYSNIPNPYYIPSDGSDDDKEENDD